MAAGRLLVDVRPLRETPAFRRLWAGSALSTFGAMITTFAVALQVHEQTHSSAAVGAIGLASALPAVSLGLIGGSVADRFDRRRLVLLTSSCLALVSVAFAVQSFAGVNQLWLLYALVAVQSVLSSIDAPARRTFMPRLVATDRIPAAAGLTMLSTYIALTLGPPMAGGLTAAGGLRICYLIDVLTFAGALYGVARLPAMTTETDPDRTGLRAVVDGLRFIRSRRVLTGALLADFSATVLGMPFALFPAINDERFGGAPTTLGLLSSAVAVGGIIGATCSGPLARVSRPGAAMLVGGTGWGAGLLGFGLARSLWLSLLMLAVAGASDVLAVICRTTVIQTATPDRFRGRVTAAEYVVGVACPQLGNFRAGAIGSLTSSNISAMGGGIATLAGAALVAVLVPALPRYRLATAAGDPPSS